MVLLLHQQSDFCNLVLTAASLCNLPYITFRNLPRYVLSCDSPVAVSPSTAGHRANSHWDRGTQRGLEMLQSPEPKYSPNTAPTNSYTPVKTAAPPLEQATIGRTLVIKGEVSGAEALYIDGRVEGTISFPGEPSDHRPQRQRGGKRQRQRTGHHG